MADASSRTPPLNPPQRGEGNAVRAFGAGVRFDLAALGEPLVELNQTRGATGEYLQGFGGDTSNCAIAASRLGARSAYVTRVGEDAFGRQFRELWGREGVDVAGVGV